MNHLDDDAELYVLGLTERERDAEIEAHVAECEACRARVVAAEEAAAALAGALPPMPAASPRGSWIAPLAMAASLVLALTAVVEGIAAHAAGAQLAHTDVALSAMAASHFSHTTLTSDPGVVAKAIYARDGSWCYVVVNGAPGAAHVLLHRGDRDVDAGALEGAGPATLFVTHPGKPDGIAIVAAARTVAHGTPIY